MASGALDAMQTIGNPHTHHRFTFIPDIHHMSLLHCCMNPAGKLNDSAFTKALGGWKAFLAILSFATVGLSHGLATAPSDSKKPLGPNVIFILADDQGWNGTSAQMHPTMPGSKSDFYQTPHIEALAHSGLRFSHAYAPGPMCSPTRASIQTGKTPAQLGMTNVGRGIQRALPSQRLMTPAFTSTLSTDERTLGEAFQDAGYATAWFGKWHLGGEGPQAHGYDRSDGNTGNENGHTRDPDNPKDIHGVTQRGLAFMEENVRRGQPFYLQLWHYAVHGPVEAHPQTIQNYEAKTHQAPGQRHTSATFAAMTQDLDTSVGKIMDKVQELSIADHTYILYMSDHGAGLNLSSNLPLREGKGTLWEGGIRVPWIMQGPGVAQGAFCQTPVVGYDLFPTLCSLAGITALPSNLAGIDLTPLLKTGQGSVHRPSDHPIMFHFPHYGRSKPHSAIRVGSFKFLHFYEQEQGMLFNLSSDPGETNDLTSTQPEKAATLRKQLEDYLHRVQAGLPVLNTRFDPLAIAQGPARGRGAGRGNPQARAGRQTRIQQFQTSLETLQELWNPANRQPFLQALENIRSEVGRTSPPRGRARIRGNTLPLPRTHFQETLDKLDEWITTGKDSQLAAYLTERIEEFKAFQPGDPRPE